MSNQPISPPGPVASRNGSQEREQPLDSWKEIADFLGVSVRTAHRWEEQAGMPLHRTPAGRVFAQPSELTRWRDSAQRKGRRRRVLGALALFALVAAGLGFVAVRQAGDHHPARVQIAGSTVSVLDARGRTAWTATVPNLGLGSDAGWEVSQPDRSLVADIDDDGQVEVLVNAISDSPADGTGRVLCYSEQGRLRWAFASGRAFTDAAGAYSPHYNVHVIRPVRVGGRPMLLVAATHRIWHPCQVALLDPASGRVVEEFWHPGALTHALLTDVDGDGRTDVVLAGVNNPGPGPGSPIVCWLRLPFSQVPPEAGSVLGSLSQGGPVAYAVFPRPDLLAAQGGLMTFHKLEAAERGTVVAHARYSRTFVGRAEPFITVTYVLDAALKPVNVFTPIQMAAAHDRAWRDGLLGHPFGDPEREWLRTVTLLRTVPDGNAVQIPPPPASR